KFLGRDEAKQRDGRFPADIPIRVRQRAAKGGQRLFRGRPIQSQSACGAGAAAGVFVLFELLNKLGNELLGCLVARLTQGSRNQREANAEENDFGSHGRYPLQPKGHTFPRRLSRPGASASNEMQGGERGRSVLRLRKRRRAFEDPVADGGDVLGGEARG